MNKNTRLSQNAPAPSNGTQKQMSKPAAVLMLLFVLAVFILFLYMSASHCGLVPSLTDFDELPEVGEFGHVTLPSAPEELVPASPGNT